MTVKPGLYKHYKGGLYRVLFTAWESTNGRPREEVVVYVSLEKGTVNVRLLEEFSMPMSEGLLRFQPVDDEEARDGHD